MHTRTTQNEFLFLRARGWSLARIADHLKVSKTTLVDWNRELHWEINATRVLEREAVYDQLLASLKEDLARVSRQWKALEKEIARRKFDDIATDKLFHLAVLLRQQHEKLQERLDSMEDRDLSIPLPIHPFAASYVDMAEFKDTYGISIVRPNPFEPESEQPESQPENSPLRGSPESDDTSPQRAADPAKPENR